MIHITTPRPRKDMGLTADQLARRLKRNGHQVNRFDVNCFLGFWLESGVVTKVRPNRYALSEYGMSLAAWIESQDERKAA